jgi:Ca2+/Na+ antiporter
MMKKTVKCFLCDKRKRTNLITILAYIILLFVSCYINDIYFYAIAAMISMCLTYIAAHNNLPKEKENKVQYFNHWR